MVPITETHTVSLSMHAWVVGASSKLRKRVMMFQFCCKRRLTHRRASPGLREAVCSCVHFLSKAAFFLATS